MKKLTIIGGGMGNEALLTGQATLAIKNAELLLATERIGETHGAEVCTLSEMLDKLENTDCQNCAAVVSGDAGFFSMSKLLAERLGARYQIQVINGLSSLQYLCGKLLIPYDNVKTHSLHGRESHSVNGLCSYNEKVFFLLDGENTPGRIAEDLTKHGLGQARVFVGEKLSYPDEGVTSALAEDIAGVEFAPLSVMLVVNEKAVLPYKPLEDADFIRGAVPMTKQNIRWLVLQKLKIAPGGILYDVGAGTGSVSVEMARRATEGMVYAFEREEEGIRLIEENRKKHGAYNLEIIHGEAPVDHKLPPPDSVFIGGSGGGTEKIVEWVTQKNPKARIVLTAITLETLYEGISVLEKAGFQTEAECLQVTVAKRTGKHHMMAANNPIFIISGEPND